MIKPPTTIVEKRAELDLKDIAKENGKTKKRSLTKTIENHYWENRKQKRIMTELYLRQYKKSRSFWTAK